VERREDGVAREVMNKAASERSTISQNGWWQIRREDCTGLKDTSSRPPKDLGGTLRRTSKTTLRSYDNRASGDLLCSHRQGAWQM